MQPKSMLAKMMRIKPIKRDSPGWTRIRLKGKLFLRRSLARCGKGIDGVPTKRPNAQPLRFRSLGFTLASAQFRQMGQFIPRNGGSQSHPKLYETFCHAASLSE